MNSRHLLALAMVSGLAISCDDKSDDTAGGDNANLDSDSDGLTDAEEATLGTDPNSDDTDGDGYLDGDEVDAGTNPLFEYSHTYTGGYNVGNCEAGMPVATGPTGSASFEYEGDTFNWTIYQTGDIPENFTFTDQFGEEVDLYSFCGQTIMLEFGAFW